MRATLGILRATVRLVGLTVALVTIAASLSPAVARAEVQNAAPEALVSFTFDDGLLSTYTQAAPTLSAHGLTGTSYVVTGCVGVTTVPNDCRANPGQPYMTWEQVTDLRSTYGWEIGSHTVDHPCLASSAASGSPGCQANKLTAAEVEAQMADSKAALAGHGIDATAFAPPYGDYDNVVLSKAAKYYTSMRGFHDEGMNEWPPNDFLLRVVNVEEASDTFASLQAVVDQAIATNAWVIFAFHDIVPTPDPDPAAYQSGTDVLDRLAAYVQAHQAAGEIRNVTVSQGLVTSSMNELPSLTSASRMGRGWTTDDPANITADTGGNGSYPEPTGAIKLVSSPQRTHTHLFSPVVNASPGTTYMFKNFLHVQSLTSGEVAFYVDEYQVDGGWISGQYRKAEKAPFVESLNFAYTPSSSAVAEARLQVIVAGAGITAYLGNAQMFPLGEEVAPPATADLLANGGFERGIGEGWTTNAPATIVADTADHGSPADPVHSVRLLASAGDSHLFSPQVAVDPSDDYTITSRLDVESLPSGEVAFYIDEYDADGTWISGQWKLGTRTPGVLDVNLTYSPTSAAVATASLQVIVGGNSGLRAFVDDVRWWEK
jgi:peptidoglycan/xylan/chitin deacetylase (PgdA/CDA1 family)